MNKPWIVFGAGTFSHLTAELLRSKGSHVQSFVVHDEFIACNESELPVHGVSEIANEFPIDKHVAITSLGYTAINERRKESYFLLKELGYRIGSLVSDHACILSDSPIYENVIIFEQAIIQPYVKLGINTIIRAGANIGHHSVVGDHSFIASGVVTGGNVTIGEQCFIGLGAIIRDNINIADRCFIGAGAVVIKDTEPDSVYVGNPARRLDKTSLEVTS